MLDWQSISDYFAAGNITAINHSEDLTAVNIDVVYYSGSLLVTIVSTCIDCYYADFRRRADHESGTGIILEAYLHTQSPLIDGLITHKLEGKAGSLLSSSAISKIHHLEIIGEISVNVLCREIVFDARGLPNSQLVSEIE